MGDFFGLRIKFALIDTFKSLPKAGSVVLTIMLLVDIAFVVMSFHDNDGRRNRFHVCHEGGFAEQWQYVKWTALALLLAFVSIRHRSAVYLAWTFVFLYFLVDDSQQLHETIGHKIAEALKLPAAFGLRPKDFGELATTAIAAIPLFGFLAVTYARTTREPERQFTQDMIGLVLALAFFGIFVDMLDIGLPWPDVRSILAIIEDGGEMVVATLMVVYAVARLWFTKPNEVLLASIGAR